MAEPREIRLKRLAMRSMRRGIKEMDILLSAFAEARLERLDDAELDTYERLLDENDQDLLVWVTGQAAPPAPLAPMVAQIADQAAGGAAARLSALGRGA